MEQEHSGLRINASLENEYSQFVTQNRELND